MDATSKAVPTKPYSDELALHILAWAAKAGPLSTGIGSFFRQLGPQAVQALAAALPDDPAHHALLDEAGWRSG